MNEMTLCKNICAQRKAAGLTQDALAAKLGVTYQAVSKWENGLSCPDVQLLPQIAEIFGISIDALFGRAMPDTETDRPAETPDALVPVTGADSELPWEDDGTLYVVLYQGHELITNNPFPIGDMCREIPFIYEGPALNINSALSVRVEGDVEGSVYAGGDVECADVGGDVSAGGSVECSDVGGSLSAGDNIGCGDVGGDVSGGGDVNCSDISGHAYAQGDISCGDISGNVYAAGDIDCGDVSGSVSAGGDVDCESVGGDVNAHGDVDSGSVYGNVRAEVIMDEEWRQKMNDMNRAANEYAKKKVEEATRRMNQANERRRTIQVEKNGRKVEIELEGIEDKVDGFVNNIEKMLDGLFDGLSFGKKKNKTRDSDKQ